LREINKLMKINVSQLQLSKKIIAGLMLASLYLFSGNLLSAAEEAEEDAEAEKPPAEVLEPVDPPDLRNDRALAENLGDSEVKWLKSGDTEFLGIFDTDSSDKTLGSVLIIPAPGNSPLVSGALPQLASGLSSSGWHSLAITLPEMDFSGPSPSFPDEKQDTEPATDENTEEPADAATENSESDNTEVKLQPELPDAKKWYADQQTKNMEKILERVLAAEAELLVNGGKYVLIAQGASAELVLELISSSVIKPSGFISLNIDYPVYQRSTKIPANLAAIKIPILDLYNISGRNKAKKRKLKQKGSHYRQIYIPANDINFRGSEALIVNRAKGWLKKQFSNSN